MKHLTEEQLSSLKSQLISQKDQLTQQIEHSGHFGMSESLLEASGDLSAYDNHPADLGTDSFERGKDLALAEQADHHLEDVNRALAEIESGNYGICKASGQPIPFERLQALPTVEYCIEHAPDTIRSDRPVEEVFLYPPFGRTSMDGRNDETEFDGEDAWQIVESWGTSNTPAMAEDPQIDSYDEMAIEADENVGYVEALESFLATDIYGRHVTVVRNKQYREYMHSQEGEPLLEADIYEEGSNDGGISRLE